MTKSTQTSTMSQFSYQPERIQVGTLYHYEKANLDDSNPAQIYIYVASKDELEVVKVETGSHALAYVTAQMDWSIFSAMRIDSWNIFPDGTLRTQAKSVLLEDEPTYVVQVGEAQFPTTITHFPFHNYNFDFTSLNFAFRHLVNPDADVRIAVVEPDWGKVMTLMQQEDGVSGEHNDILVNRGLLELIFQGDEMCNGQLCRKYRLDGPGLLNNEGYLWVHKTDGHFVKFAHPHPDNPQWSSFQLTLQSTSKLSAEAWQHFIDEVREENNKLFSQADE